MANGKEKGIRKGEWEGVVKSREDAWSSEKWREDGRKWEKEN